MIKYADGVFSELVEIATYLGSYDEAVSMRFLDACNESFAQLENYSEMGSPRMFSDPELASVRMSLVKGFDDYLIFYTPLVGGIRILHVMHSARDYNRIVGRDDLS